MQSVTVKAPGGPEVLELTEAAARPWSGRGIGQGGLRRAESSGQPCTSGSD